MSKKKADPESVTLTFDLHDLPTAQHRAGLAGLILQIDSMGEGKNNLSQKLLPTIKELTATSATITFTRDSMRGVFDDLYAAKLVQIVVAARWPGETKPKPGEFFVPRKDPKTGEIKQAAGFAYDVVQPQSPCLSSHFSQGEKSPWLALWRQMLWSIPRGGNNVRSRVPFIDLAGKRSCGEGATAWTQMVDLQEKKAQSRFPTAPISGALMLGAQAINAESVPFEGRVDHNLLLHFWQLVVLTFRPHVVNKKDAKVEQVGFVLAIPDIADLVAFRELFPEILAGRPASEPERTPPTARLDLPDQAGLEVFRWWKESEAKPEDVSEGTTQPGGKTKQPRLRRNPDDLANQLAAIRELAATNASKGWGVCVRAVESYHMLKAGNNVKLLSYSRLAGRPGLVEDYEAIRKYRSPLFRAALMRALIRGESWHSGMIELFSEYPWPFFIEGEQTPRFLPRFGRDAKEQFHNFQRDLRGMALKEMDAEERIKHLGTVVQKIINRYVEGRAEKKTGIKVSSLPKRVVKDKQGQSLKKPNGEDLVLPVYPKEFREVQQRVCSDAFLSMRSRHDQDFVEYFAGSICSVDHQLSQANYQFLVQILMTNPDPNPVGPKRLCWEDVKAIAMIAASACSFQVRPHDAESQGSSS